MEKFLCGVVGIFVYLLGFVPFSGYLGYYYLDDWYWKWERRVKIKEDYYGKR